MHGDLLLILVVLIFGCAAFLFGVVYIVCSAIGFVGRSLLSIVRPCSRVRVSAGSHLRMGHPLICPRESCRKIEYRRASFCSQCGSRLAASLGK
jgi:hypothetical protein